MEKSNFKLTNQRVFILEFLKENYDHPTVNEIFNYVKAKLPRISKKTVYNNLQLLSKEGLLQEVNVSGVQRYEPKLAPHHHLICRKCGNIKDIDSENLLSHVIKFGKRIKDFDVEFSHVHFHGVCKKCKEENKNGTRRN